MGRKAVETCTFCRPQPLSDRLADEVVTDGPAFLPGEYEVHAREEIKDFEHSTMAGPDGSGQQAGRHFSAKQRQELEDLASAGRKPLDSSADRFPLPRAGGRPTPFLRPRRYDTEATARTGQERALAGKEVQDLGNREGRAVRLLVNRADESLIVH